MDTALCPGQILLDSLINNSNEDTKGKLAAFVVDTELGLSLNTLRESTGIQKDFIRLQLWADRNTGRRGTGLTSIHMKKTWVFSPRASSGRSDGKSQQAVALSPSLMPRRVREKAGR